MALINFDDKVDLTTKDFPEINKITAQNINDLKNGVNTNENSINAISQGTGETYETRALAMLEDPLPADDTPFVVYNESGYNGQYRYNSAEGSGYSLIQLYIEVESTPTEGSTKLVESGGIASYVSSEIANNSWSISDVLNLTENIRKDTTTSNVRDGLYISFSGYHFANPDYEILVYPVIEGQESLISGQCTATNDQQGTTAYGYYIADNSSSFILNSLVVIDQNAVEEIATVSTAPATANFLMVTRKKTIDDISVLENIDIETIKTESSTALANSIKNETKIEVMESATQLELGYNLEVPNVIINFLGNAFWSDNDFDVFKWKIDPNKKYKLTGQSTGTTDTNGCGAFGYYETDLPNSLISFTFIAKNKVLTYNDVLTIPSNATYLMITQKRGIDSVKLVEVVNGNDLGTYSNSLQFARKKLFTIGDSFVFLAHHLPKLLETTQMEWHGTSGQEGNGREYTYFPQMIYNNDPQFDPRDWHTQISESDLVLIMGGANDYLNTNVPLGSITDTPLTDLELDNGGSGDGQLCTSIYQAIFTMIKVIQDIDYTTKIVFVTQSEVGNYGGKPTATTTPSANGQGLTMANIAEAVMLACKSKGIASFDTHNRMWSHAELPLYTYDNLHPSNSTTNPSTDTSTESGGDRMGRQIGKAINTL